jgi:SAM-dependent methyltransferase
MNEIQQKIIWDHFQTSELSVFAGAHPRLTSLAKQVPNGGRILNVGIGDGFLEARALLRGAEVYSLDPSEDAVKKLAASMGDPDSDHFKDGFVESMPFPKDFFDVVVMSEVLEHLGDESLSQALQEVHRVLKPGGKFIGTVPAEEDLSLNLVLCPCCETKFHRWGHQQSFTRERFGMVLELNFVGVSVQRAYFPDLKNYSWKGKLLALAKLCVCRFGKGGTNENWQFVARKRAN